MQPAFPLEKLTSFKIGGPADRLVFPDSGAVLADELRRAADRELPARALGGGRNLLVDDRGVPGLVVSLSRFRKIECRGSEIVAGAGVPLGALIRRAAAAGLAGLEVLAGIPGTVGGAVRMNAGGALGAIGDRVRLVRGLDPHGEPFALPRDECGFGYRKSRFEHAFITEVVLELSPSRADLGRRAREILSRKRATQPLEAATAGCVFKNPADQSAGWLLDQVGMKGRRCGAAQVSKRHANFVMNLGGASFADVVTLITAGRKRVREEFGTDLKLEVEVWQREEDPSSFPACSIAWNP